MEKSPASHSPGILVNKGDSQDHPGLSESLSWLLTQNIQNLQLKGEKVYFGSRFLEVSGHSQLAPGQHSMTLGHGRGIAAYWHGAAYGTEVGRQRVKAGTGP